MLKKRVAVTLGGSAPVSLTVLPSLVALANLPEANGLLQQLREIWQRRYVGGALLGFPLWMIQHDVHDLLAPMTPVRILETRDDQDQQNNLQKSVYSETYSRNKLHMVLKYQVSSLDDWFFVVFWPTTTNNTVRHRHLLLTLPSALQQIIKHMGPE